MGLGERQPRVEAGVVVSARQIELTPDIGPPLPGEWSSGLEGLFRLTDVRFNLVVMDAGLLMKKSCSGCKCHRAHQGKNQEQSAQPILKAESRGRHCPFSLHSRLTLERNCWRKPSPAFERENFANLVPNFRELLLFFVLLSEHWLELVDKITDVLELAVNAGETDVGNLVKLLEL